MRRRILTRLADEHILEHVNTKILLSMISNAQMQLMKNCKEKKIDNLRL